MSAWLRTPRSFLLCLLILAVVTGCGSESPAPSPKPGESGLTPLPTDPAKLGTTEYDVTYGNVSGVALKMDIHYPEVADKPVPAVIYVHGGGWVSGDKAEGAGARIIPEMVFRGYLEAAINYRLAPEYKFPAQIEDVKCAVRYLRANAAAYGIDATRIGAFGGSAGGHLVALLGTSDPGSGLEGSRGYGDQSSRVQAVADLYGPADLAAMFDAIRGVMLPLVFGTTDLNSEIVSNASPVTHVTSDDPPFLILHGDKDILVPLSQSEVLYDRLVAAQVPVTMVVVQNGAHGFRAEGGPMTPTWGEIIDTIADFFDRHLK